MGFAPRSVLLVPPLSESADANSPSPVPRGIRPRSAPQPDGLTPGLICAWLGGFPKSGPRHGSRRSFLGCPPRFPGPTQSGADQGPGSATWLSPLVFLPYSPSRLTNRSCLALLGAGCHS
ncbi:hypothetical protein B0H67DRAFT_390999 [Lasiosphaeris hirsuta]|uniref:Uncharacterized protein n=1 Tax=Lasiosphaeris hirsuta TaxID=260670 RepID=A0AA39ZSA3_9PEZI|nr:hypothetical protein B0H67DRAFT_390999 [Lasiosphaeris hirsuta]